MFTRSRRSARSIVPLLFLALAMPFASRAHAQLTPDRTYYGIDRPMPMTVQLPAGAEGDVEIHLLAPVSAELVEKTAAASGKLNLAEKFPSLWTTKDPRLLYAQLVVGGKKIGPAVVLQPLLTPRSVAADRTGAPAFMPEENWKQMRQYSGIRAYTDKHVVIDTAKGEIEIALRPDVAPNTVWNFRELVAGGFYTDIAMHRIIPNFVIQFGDPNGVGNGGPGFHVDLEPSTLPHDFGVISMARSRDPNSGGSQVFLCLSREATQSLDRGYTSFGETVKGADAIQALGATPLIPNTDKPAEPPLVKSAKLVDAPPYGDGPKPVKKPGAENTGR